jgi:hypothetical protein
MTMVGYSIWFCRISNCSVTKGEEGLIPEDPHHPSLLISIDVRIKIRKFIYGVEDADNFNFRVVDMELVHNALVIDWSFLDSYENVDLACRGLSWSAVSGEI